MKKGLWRISGAAIKNLFTKPVTISYPKGKWKRDKRYRGLLTFNKESCIGCGMCMRDCPTAAIKVVNEGTKEDKAMRAFLNTGRCIFCGQCADSCPKSSIHLTSQGDLAKFAHDDLDVEI